MNGAITFYSLRVFGQAGSTGKVLEWLNSGPGT